MRLASGGDVGSRKVSSERDTGRVGRSFTDIIVITILYYPLTPMQVIPDSFLEIEPFTEHLGALGFFTYLQVLPFLFSL